MVTQNQPKLLEENGPEALPANGALQPATPMEMVRAAVEQGASIDIIERLVALQERMMARDAEAAFNVSMNRAQECMGPVRADLTNPQTKSKYASYATLDNKVRPIYAKEGFALSFDTADAPKDEYVRVLCYVSHASGYTKTYHVDMPADGKGAKGGDVMTKTHAAGAAMSYGMRYLLKMIFNIAVGEDDKDGNVTNGEMKERLEWIENCRDVPELQKIYLAALQSAIDAKDGVAANALTVAKNKRKAELEGSGQ